MPRIMMPSWEAPPPAVAPPAAMAAPPPTQHRRKKKKKKSSGAAGSGGGRRPPRRSRAADDPLVRALLAGAGRRRLVPAAIRIREDVVVPGERLRLEEGGGGLRARKSGVDEKKKAANGRIAKDTEATKSGIPNDPNSAASESKSEGNGASDSIGIRWSSSTEHAGGGAKKDASVKNSEIAKMRGAGSDDIGGNFGFASTKRRLTYGLSQEDPSDSNAGMGEDEGAAERRGGKKRRSDPVAGDQRSSTTKSPSAIGRGEVALPRAEKQGDDETRLCSRKTSPFVFREAIFLRSKPAAPGIHKGIPSSKKKDSRLSQRDLLLLARKHRGTAVQFVVAYHTGEDPILDNNAFPEGEQRRIEPGDLVVRQEYANARGTAWSAKHGFWHWRLPGKRVPEKRPVLASEADGRAGANVGPVGNGGMGRPRLVVDASVSARDVARVLRFVREAAAGTTPSEFFSGGQWMERSESRECGGEGEDDAFGFVDGAESSKQGWRPKERRALDDRSNTVDRVPAGGLKRESSCICTIPEHFFRFVRLT